MSGRVVLPHALRERMKRAARDAFPHECCGLLEGMRQGGTLRIADIHPMRNLATEPDRFEIDPAGQIALLKRLRGTDRDVVGCYHSHPNGRAEPSARDRANGSGDNFVWIIVGVSSGDGETCAAFVAESGEWRALDLEDESQECS